MSLYSNLGLGRTRMDSPVSGGSHLSILHEMHEAGGKGEDAESICVQGQVCYQVSISVLLIIFEWETGSVKQIQGQFKWFVTKSVGCLLY